MKLYVNSICTFVVLAASLSLLTSATAPISAPIAATTLAGPPAPALPTVKSYREWKASMVTEAEARLKTTREIILSKRRGAASKDPNLAAGNSNLESGLNNDLQTMHSKFEKESLQLSMAHDLTISDYFVGYLTKQRELDKAIREVSSRLSAEEVAELMSAYANNFFSSKPTGAKAAPQADSTGALNR
ncbi:MAG: hypothetical protein H7328_09470 [Bdellovibrio sp.]|nr:hypothetical protein [Bdellovibrio sp.]